MPSRRDGMLEYRKVAGASRNMYDDYPEQEEDERGEGRSDVYGSNEDDDVRVDINEENLTGSKEGYQVEEEKLIDEKLSRAAAEEAGDNFANTEEAASEKFGRDQVDQGFAESIQSDEGMLADSDKRDTMDKVEEGKVSALIAEKKALTGEGSGQTKEKSKKTLDKH